jgi:hypothetical protein
MSSDLLPPNFPLELVRLAFSSRDEVTWSANHAVFAVEWFGAHGYAILGTELWVVQTDAIQSLPLGHDGMPGVYGNTVDQKEGETWDSFVMRSMAETRAYLKTFNHADIAEPGQLYFNVVWSNESDFKKLVHGDFLRG